MTVKWSAFPSGTNPAGTDVVVGLQGGINVQWTWSQVGLGLTVGTTTITSGSSTRLLYDNAGVLGEASGVTTNGTNLTLGSTSQLLWSTDLILTRAGAASLQLGAGDAASPIAQTLQTQSVVAGTTNTAGANFNVVLSKSTGNAAGGSLIIQGSAAGSSGSAQNAASQVVKVDNSGNVSLAGNLGSNFSASHTTAIVGVGLDGSFGGGNTGIFRFGDQFNQISSTFGGTVTYNAYNGHQFVTNPGTFLAQIGGNGNALGNAFSGGTFFGGSTTATITVHLLSSGALGWDNGSGTPDLLMTRKGAANIQIGAADAAAPVAQTLSVQSVVAGTSNTSGVSTTIIGSLSTGSGTSGDIIFQTGGTGAGSTAQNTATTALTIKGATQQVIMATTPRISVAPTSVSGAGPIAIGSGSTINNRIQLNLNGTTYWIPCTTTAF